MLAAEQERIERERADARKWATAATRDLREVKDALKEALTLLTDTNVRYLEATPNTRRLLNQALFKALLVLDGEVSQAEPTPWVAAIRALALPAAGPAQQAQDGTEASQGRRRNDHDPLSRAVGLYKAKMVRRAGLEPAPPD